MALSITLSSDVPLTYRLPTERVLIAVDRTPIQSPLPGIDPLIYDLGSFRISITCQGVVHSSSGSDGGVTIPSKRELEDFCTDLFASTITISINVNGNTDSYIGKIRSCTFTINSAREDFWDFALNILTVSRS